MTEQFAFDRALEAALATGPQLAPPQLVNDAISDALRRPQRRSRFARLDRRAWPPVGASVASPAVWRSVRLVLVIAAVALALTVGLVVGARLLQRDEQPAPFRTTTLVSAGTLPITVSEPLGVSLADGGILVGGYGGSDATIAAVFDPRDGTSTALDGGLPHVSLLDAGPLPDGRVVLLGWAHTEPAENGQSYLWVYDPVTASVSQPIKTLQPRIHAALAILPDGRALVSGGIANPMSSAALRSTELFDPSTSTLVEGPALAAPRVGHRTATLADARVLIVGGSRTFPSHRSPSLEVVTLDAGTGESEVVGRLEELTRTFGGGPLPVPLVDGRVLLTGWQEAPQICCRHEVDPVRAYLFDPENGTFARAADLPHTPFAAVALPDGRVVITGYWQVDAGDPDQVTDGWVGVYDPSTGVTLESRDPITGVASLPVDTDRRYSDAALLHDGRVALMSEDVMSIDPNYIDILTVAAP